MKNLLSITSGSEPMIDGIRENFEAIGEGDILTRAKVTANSGFHCEANTKAKPLIGRAFRYNSGPV